MRFADRGQQVDEGVGVDHGEPVAHRFGSLSRHGAGMSVGGERDDGAVWPGAQDHGSGVEAMGETEGDAGALARYGDFGPGDQH